VLIEYVIKVIDGTPEGRPMLAENLKSILNLEKITKSNLSEQGYAPFTFSVKPIENDIEKVQSEGYKLYEDGYVREKFILVPKESTEVDLDAILKDVQSDQIAALNKQFDEYINRYLEENNSLSEQLSWDTQEKEARAYIADNTVVTPYIDRLLESRNKGETKTELVNKIIAKADAYTEFHSSFLGELHSKIDEVKTSTINYDTARADLDAIKAIILVDPSEV